MKTLVEIWHEKGYGYYPTDKWTEHSYLEVYDELFARFQDKPVNLLEAGVSSGGSVRLFRDYFTQAQIYALNIVDGMMPEIDLERITKITMDVRNIKSDQFINLPLHLAIDDASHILEDQLYFVKTVFPQIASGGLLIVEDIWDIDRVKPAFDDLRIPYTLIDLRKMRGRDDDIMLLYRKR